MAKFTDEELFGTTSLSAQPSSRFTDEELFGIEKERKSWLDAMWSGAKIGFMDTARGVQQIAGINEEELAEEQRELNALMEDEEVGWAAKTGYFGGLIADPVGWMLPVSSLATLMRKVD